MRNCPVCGIDVPDTARFCRHCGHTLGTLAPGGGMIDMENSSAADAQLRDVANVPTQTLTNNNKKKRAQVGLPASSTSSEKQPGSSNQYPSREDNDGQPNHAILADVPTIDLPARSENGLPSVKDTSVLPETAHISEVPTATLMNPAPKEDISQEAQASVVSPPASQEAPSLESPSSPDDSASPIAPAEPARAPAVKRGMSSAAKWLIIGLIALVLIAGGLGALLVFLHPHFPGTGGTPGALASPSAITRTTPAASPCPGSTSSNCSGINTISTPTANKGTVDLTFSGAVTGSMTGTRVVTCGAEQSVAGGMQYHVALFGTVGGQQYALTFGVYPYTSPDTYISSAFSFFGPAGGSSSITQWRSSPKLGVSVIINSDGKSGSLDIGYVSSTDNSTAHIAGSWKCT